MMPEQPAMPEQLMTEQQDGRVTASPDSDSWKQPDEPQRETPEQTGGRHG
jgi:hypothetical protein